jgi:hypothetical protein
MFKEQYKGIDWMQEILIPNGIKFEHMSVAVCCCLLLSTAVSQHKYIWIGYIENVNCTGTKAVIVDC